MRHLFICTLLCLLPIAALAQTTSLPPQPRQAKGPDLSTNTASVLDWAKRVTASDPKVRAIAEAALVKAAARSLPLLKRFLARDDENLALRTFEIIRRIGPPAIPLLLELLRHEQVSFRRFAADALIDLAPDTESIQPALRRSLRDEDAEVAGDAARALGALGKRATPSVTRPRQGSLARGSIRPHLRGGVAGVHRPDGSRGDSGPRQGRGRPDSRRPMGSVRGPRKHRPCRRIRCAAVDRSADG